MTLVAIDHDEVRVQTKSQGRTLVFGFNSEDAEGYFAVEDEAGGQITFIKLAPAAIRGLIYEMDREIRENGWGVSA